MSTNKASIQCLWTTSCTYGTKFKIAPKTKVEFKIQEDFPRKKKSLFIFPFFLFVVKIKLERVSHDTTVTNANHGTSECCDFHQMRSFSFRIPGLVVELSLVYNIVFCILNILLKELTPMAKTLTREPEQNI